MTLGVSPLSTVGPVKNTSMSVACACLKSNPPVSMTRDVAAATVPRLRICSECEVFMLACSKTGRQGSPVVDGNVVPPVFTMT